MAFLENLNFIIARNGCTTSKTISKSPLYRAVIEVHPMSDIYPSSSAVNIESVCPTFWSALYYSIVVSTDNRLNVHNSAHIVERGKPYELE